MIEGLLVTFVHLGDNLPRHLRANLVRFREMFPDVQVTLVGDSRKSQKFAERQGTPFFNYDKQHQLSRLGLEIGVLNHDPRFWSGYWQKTFDRLLALEALHSKYPGSRILHVESDVILLPNFPFNYFEKLEKLAWLEYNLEFDIASLLFSPTLTDTKWLIERLCQETFEDPWTTDMRALRKIRILDSGDKVTCLPRFPSDDVGFSANLEGTSFLFDGAQFGQWLLGWDPNAHWGLGRNRFWTGEGVSPFESASFFQSRDELKVSFQGIGTYEIANLHIHSKEIALFTERYSQSISEACGRLDLDKTSYSFHVLGLFRWSFTMLNRWSRSVYSLKAWQLLWSRLAKTIRIKKL